MCPVGQPDPGRVDVLAGGDRGCVPDKRHEVLLAARLHPDDGEAGICIVERHALDGADQRFALGATLVFRHLADISIS